MIASSIKLICWFSSKKIYCWHEQLLSDSLEKRVNKKVMAMFEKAEDEYNDLMSKKSIIEVSKMSSIA